MKHYKTISFTILLLFILFGSNVMAQPPSIRNKDGSIDKENVIKEFNTYIDTIGHLPSTEEESWSLIKNFTLYLFPYEIKIRDNATFSDKTYTNEQQSQINSECYNELFAILDRRIKERTETTNQNIAPGPENIEFHNNLDWRIIALIGSVVMLMVLIIVFVRISKKDKKKSDSNVEKHVMTPPVYPVDNIDAGIVVRRKTESIMKKQCLDDVVDNSNYLKIDGSDFCADTAVRRIYIKNTCIKDIYNIYADDLRNPNNPKEDGCMVLGRWVHDKTSNEYDVSLEEIVLPGDDAVFSEYELNFGGKIKLKATERLKKLRRETDQQYDLTCWVHSHPGLGVFFSNSDSNVQTQLKHPSHPNFLTAFVVDILTPKQDLGIFTFKHDTNINSKTDLKKLYSLEEWYQWALESERNNFQQEDHYDTLSNASQHFDYCHSIQFNNSAIIDISLLSANFQGELVRWIHGFSNHQAEKVNNIVVKVSETDNENDSELIGAFVIAPHCSIPSIRKAIAIHIEQIKFVAVYSTSNGLLTSIPIVDKDLCSDEKYYGEQKLEDLKIWTRRKR